METLRLHPQSKGKPELPGESILAQGTVVQGRYEVMKVLGLGGMGAVYQARDLRFTGAQRLCALKEIISATHDPKLRQVAVHSFEREANLLASLNHPAIPKIYDYFSEGVRNYLVLEFIEGMDLEAVLRSTRAPLPVERVVDWAIQICDVLSYLHGQNPPIIFRDLKPSNIMIRPPNHIVLIDFGIARVFRSGQKGTMIGTEGYSPPEQYRGVASIAGDLYALGATLHHLLTGRDPRRHPPFTFHEALPRTLNPGVSEALENVIMKALAYEATERYASAEAMRAALLNANQSSHETTPTEAKTVASLSSSASQETREATGAPDLRIHGEQILPVWQFTCEDEVRSSPVVVEGVVYVGSYDNNLYALDARNGRFLWKFPTEGGIAATPCVWKDRVLIGSEDRLLYAITVATGRILWTCPTEGRVRSSARAEYEHAFFGSDDHRLYAVNVNSGRVVWRFEAIDAIRSTPAIGDELVYVGSEDGHLYAVDLQTGRQRWKFRANRAITSSPLLCNELLVVGSSDWNVYAVDARSGWSVWRFRTGQAVIGSPRLGDNVVYIGSVDGNVYALDIGTGRQVWKFEAGAPVVSTPAATEQAVYFGTIGGEVISVSAKTGKERWRFTTGGPVPSSPCVAEGLVYIGSNDHKVYALPA